MDPRFADFEARIAAIERQLGIKAEEAPAAEEEVEAAPTEESPDPVAEERTDAPKAEPEEGT